MTTNKIKIVFWMLVINFIFLVLQMTVEFFRDILSGSYIFLIPFIIFFILGIVLMVLSVKTRLEHKEKIYLIISGFSASGVFFFVLLHNIFYAFSVMAADYFIAKLFLELLSASFFIFALFVCPAGFFIGVIGSVVMFIRNKAYDQEKEDEELMEENQEETDGSVLQKEEGEEEKEEDAKEVESEEDKKEEEIEAEEDSKEEEVSPKLTKEEALKNEEELKKVDGL
jgi:hypothetical protein